MSHAHKCMWRHLCKWLASWTMPGIVLRCPAASKHKPSMMLVPAVPIVALRCARCDIFLAKHKGKGDRKNTPNSKQVATYKPNDSCEIENCPAILLNPEIIWFYL